MTYFNIYKNVIYSSEGSRDPSEIILICWKQFLVSMLKGIVPVFLWKPWLFFQNSLINKKLKRTEFSSHWNVLQHYKCVYSHYDNLHPCGIKAQISYRIKKTYWLNFWTEVYIYSVNNSNSVNYIYIYIYIYIRHTLDYISSEWTVTSVFSALIKYYTIYIVNQYKTRICVCESLKKNTCRTCTTPFCGATAGGCISFKLHFNKQHQNSKSTARWEHNVHIHPRSNVEVYL